MIDDPTVLAAAIVTVIAAIVTGTVTVFGAVSAAADRRDARKDRQMVSDTLHATDRKADVIIEKATEIHSVTNSHLSKVTAALEVANEKILGLEKLIAQVVKEQRDTEEGAAVESLQRIDDNTAAIEANTARTEEKVDKL